MSIRIHYIKFDSRFVSGSTDMFDPNPRFLIVTFLEEPLKNLMGKKLPFFIGVKIFNHTVVAFRKKLFLRAQHLKHIISHIESVTDYSIDINRSDHVLNHH